MRASSGSLGAEPIRVAAPVDALVVGAHPLGDVGEAGVQQDAGTDLGVAPHLLPLHVAQRAGLVEDRVGDPELAEIVQDAGGVDALHPLGGESAAPRSRARTRRTARMLARAPVAHVEGLRQEHRGRQPQLRGRLGARPGLAQALLHADRGVVHH